jgi:hypothetical protein
MLKANQQNDSPDNSFLWFDCRNVWLCGWKKGTKSAGNANGNVAHCSKGTMAELRHLGAESLA